MPRPNSYNLIEKIYFSDCEYNGQMPYVEKLVEMSKQEIEEIVGRFRNHSIMRGKLRGALYVYGCGKVEIRHHLTRIKLWEN